MNQIIKVLLYVLLVLLVSIAGLGIAGFLLEDKLVRLSLEQLNRQVNVTIKAQGVKVSLIRGFPYASVSMKRVEIIEGSLDTQPEFEPGLLSLEEVTLKIGLLGILKNEYDIDELILRNGWLNLYFDQKGRGNFEIFEREDSSIGNWLFDLKQFRLDNVTISYIDPRTGWVFKGLVDEAKVKGRFSSQVLMLELQSKLRVGSLKQGNFYYLRNQNVNFGTTLLVSDNTVSFSASEVRVGNTYMNAKGNFGRGQGAPIQLNVSGKNLDVTTLLALLSQFNLTLPPDTKTKGQIAFNLNIDGYNKVETPFGLTLLFSTDFFEIDLPNKPVITIKDINGKFDNGNLNKPETSEIYISNFSAIVGESTARGSLKIKNLLSPLYHINVNHSINIIDIASLGLSTPLKSGTFNGIFEALGMLADIENINFTDFRRSKFHADIDFDNVSYSLTNRDVNIENAMGVLKLINQDITRALARGRLNGSDFEAEFNISNATAILFEKGKSTINASITIDSLNTSWLLAEREQKNEDSGENSMWKHINSITSDIFIDKLVYGDFVCQPLTANLYLKENHYISNSFLIRSCEGMFTGRFSQTHSGGSSSQFSADITIDGVNITQLFESFNDFGQQIVKSSNISGQLDGVLLFSSPIVNGSFLRDDMAATANLKISDGRLVHLKQLEGLSRFVELDELRDIRFQTLENSIRVENQQVIIPRMDILSSAMDLSLSGTHAFSGAYLYRMELLLSDVLFSKASGNKPENNQFGEIVHDGTGRSKLYLKIEGDADDFTVSYDRRAARDAFRDKLREEKQTLKNIFRDEFAFFRRKENIQEIEDKTDSTLFGYDSEDDIISEESGEPKQDNPKDKPKFTIEWDDE